MRKWWLAFIIFCLTTHGAFASRDIHRGAKFFFQYCSGCHSLKYGASDLWDNKQLAPIPWRRRIMNGKWLTSLAPKDSHKWFGQTPPDLSLEGQKHSRQWIIDYLMGFYDDSQHPFGRNNIVFKDVNMPDVLYSVSHDRQSIAIDIADFLVFVAHPESTQRYWVGCAVMLLCLFALCLTWCLKNKY